MAEVLEMPNAPKRKVALAFALGEISRLLSDAAVPPQVLEQRMLREVESLLGASGGDVRVLAGLFAGCLSGAIAAARDLAAELGQRSLVRRQGSSAATGQAALFERQRLALLLISTVGEQESADADQQAWREVSEFLEAQSHGVSMWEALVFLARRPAGAATFLSTAPLDRFQRAIGALGHELPPALSKALDVARDSVPAAFGALRQPPWVKANLQVFQPAAAPGEAIEVAHPTGDSSIDVTVERHTREAGEGTLHVSWKSGAAAPHGWLFALFHGEFPLPVYDLWLEDPVVRRVELRSERLGFNPLSAPLRFVIRAAPTPLEQG